MLGVLNLLCSIVKLIGYLQFNKKRQIMQTCLGSRGQALQNYRIVIFFLINKLFGCANSKLFQQNIVTDNVNINTIS